MRGALRPLSRIMLVARSGTNQSLPVGAPRAVAPDLTRNRAWSRSLECRPVPDLRWRLQGTAACPACVRFTAALDLAA